MKSISENLGFDLRRLTLLAQLRSLGTIAAVAEAEHLTASAVSQQLHALSRDVGVPLFQRRGRGVLVTEYGRALIAVLNDLEIKIRSTREIFVETAAGVIGTVRAGGFATSITHLLAPAVAASRRNNSGVRIELSEFTPIRGLSALDNGRLDLLIGVDFPGAPTLTDPRFLRTDLLRDVMDVALPEDHPLAAYDAIELRQLREEVWVAPAANEPCAHILLGLCATEGFTPDIRHSCDEWTAVTALIAHGAGISLVPRLAQPLHQPSVKTIPLRGNPAARTIFALTSATDRDAPAIAAILALIVEAAENLDPAS
ncbi:LysR family transcriptional regulator [Rathayibacter sp. AY2B7]|uniref:LysR family transcriptional regulator n=1 Tax=Rathayibacter sp. AY2B7 TaxID=2080571 RepID=UPI0015E47D20|nr:LysR family transcriptional regulator [Rathayibacter sp. AY2B7]